MSGDGAGAGTCAARSLAPAPAAAPAAGASRADRPAAAWVRHRATLAAGVALLTVVAFLPALDCGFVAWDDPQTVARYQVVLRGLTSEGAVWAFTHEYFAHWLPLTVLSHMADWELFGAEARGHHLTSLLLHAATAALTFLLWRQATGRTGRALAIAALWAVHPLRVQPVVWVAARKDMLSGTLGLLALLFYVLWVRRPSWRRYVAVVAALLLGLLSKAILVSLPLVMLLLDFWPLGRLRLPASGAWRDRLASLWRDGWPLLREKLPLFALAAAFSAGAVVSQRVGGAIAPLEALPLGARVGNALLAYAHYLGDTFWPTGLAAFYPLPMVPPGWPVVLAAALLFCGLLAGALAAAPRWPWLTCGWLWFVVMVLPVSGIVQVGDQARADRCTYLASIGLLAALVWTVAEAAQGHSRRRAVRPLLAIAAAGLVVASVAATRQTIPHWRDTETVFRRMLAVTDDNHVGHLNLGTELLRQGRVAEALPHLREATRIRPGLALSWVQLGSALRRAGERAAARDALGTALRLHPELPSAHVQLAALLEEEGEAGAAVGHLAFAVAADPGGQAAWAGIRQLVARPGVARAALPYVAAVARQRPRPEVTALLAGLERLAAEQDGGAPAAAEPPGGGR